MGSIITFHRHRFQGWTVQVDAELHNGWLARVIVHVETPDRGMPGGMLAFVPGIPGFEQAQAAAFNGGVEDTAALLEWIVESTRVALDTRTDIGAGARTYWERAIDLADETRADFFARYPDGMVPAFEVIGRLIVDARTLAGVS